MQVARDDARDLYNRVLAHWLWPAVLVWLVSTFVLRVASHSAGENNTVVSHSRDAGLQMTLHSPFPALLLSTHSVCGALLLVGCMIQKLLVARMATGRASAGWMHRVNGYACVLAMTGMWLPGLLMSPYSAWAYFEWVSLLFAAPWLAWTVALLVAPSRRFHRLVGNQILKGCLTVPGARLCGSVVQRAWPQLGEPLGYYLGIGMVTLAVGVWEATEVAAFLKTKSKE